MLDAPLRAAAGPTVDRLGARLARAGVRAGHVTAGGLALGLASAVAAGTARWHLALGLWLASRALDALDGAVARGSSEGPSAWGGFADIVADFAVYGAFVVGVAVAVPEARVAAAALLLAYYVNGATVLALSGMAERLGVDLGDERSVRFSGGLAEGVETIVAHSLFCLLPWLAAEIAWVFAAVVAVTALQRVLLARRLLRR